MSIDISPIRRTFNYQGIMLPDVPGLDPREVRDLYSAQYPELVSAEVEAGDMVGGVQEWTFRKAVGVKGGTPPCQGERLAALRRRVQAEAEGQGGSDSRLTQALSRRSHAACAQAWSGFAAPVAHAPQESRAESFVAATSDMLAPLP